VYRVGVVLVVSTTTRFSALRLRPREDEDEEQMEGAEEVVEEPEEEVNEDSESVEVLEEREDGRESKSDSERLSGKEMTWTELAGFVTEEKGISKDVFDSEGEKVPLVGVGETMEMSHFDSMANISSASLSSCVDSSSCCASVGGRVRRLRDESRAEKGLSCEAVFGNESSQTLAVLPSGICMETQAGAMWSSNVFPPSMAIQSDQGKLAAMHAAWMGRGGGVAGDNESVRVPEDEDRKAEVRVELRTSWREETFEVRRGCVRKVVAWVIGAGVDWADIV
jgi:hypothetical protein